MNPPATPPALLDLVKRYPLSLRSFLKPRYKEPLAWWGFMCGYGWAQAIAEFCSWMEPLAERERSLGHRMPRITELSSDHGLLNVHVTGIPVGMRQELLKRILRARERSSTVCEIDGRVRYKLTYTVGEPVIEEFANEDEARWAIRNEGDHLLDARRLPTAEVLMETLDESIAKEEPALRSRIISKGGKLAARKGTTNIERVGTAMANPGYETDDGPLTEKDIEHIRATAKPMLPSGKKYSLRDLLEEMPEGLLLDDPESRAWLDMEPVGREFGARPTCYHSTLAIFRRIHGLASHGPTPTVRLKWKHAEERLLARYCPRLVKLVRLGIKKERI